MRARIYVCHTFYHVYVACLKELNLPKEERGKGGRHCQESSGSRGEIK